MVYAALCALLLPLLDDRPPTADLDRFPSAEICLAQLKANEAHETYLYARLEVEGQVAELYHRIVEANHLAVAWQLLLEAHQLPDRRRVRLAMLRAYLGGAAYYAGTMPPCVPWHRFTYRD